MLSIAKLYEDAKSPMCLQALLVWRSNHVDIYEAVLVTGYDGDRVTGSLGTNSLSTTAED